MITLLPENRPPWMRPRRSPLSARKVQRTLRQRRGGLLAIARSFKTGPRLKWITWPAKAVRRANNKHHLNFPVHPTRSPQLPRFSPGVFRRDPGYERNPTHPANAFIHRIRHSSHSQLHLSNACQESQIATTCSLLMTWFNRGRTPPHFHDSSRYAYTALTNALQVLGATRERTIKGESQSISSRPSGRGPPSFS
jgi:hypothetical protein